MVLGINPYHLTIMALEQPQMLAQLAAAQGIEPPGMPPPVQTPATSPERAQQLLQDPSLSPQERDRLRGIAAPGPLPTPESTGSPDVGSMIMNYLKGRMSLGETPSLQTNPYEKQQGTTGALAGPPVAPATGDVPSPYGTGVIPIPQPQPYVPQTLMAPPEPAPAVPPVAPPGTVRPPVAAPVPVAVPVAPPAPQVQMPGSVAPQMPGNAAAATAAGGAPANPNAADQAQEQAQKYQKLADALKGLQKPSTGGDSKASRAPSPVAPYNPGALQPQTQQIITALMQGGQVPPSLAQLLAR